MSYYCETKCLLHNLLLVTFFSSQNGNLNVVGLDLRIYVLGINLSIPSCTFRRAYLVRDIQAGVSKQARREHDLGMLLYRSAAGEILQPGR